jgi:preprotein translocase subunit SecF
MRHSLHSALITLAGFAFSLGIMGFVLGQLITFVPGAESSWFIASGILVLAGLVLPRWYERVTAVVLFGICILAANPGPPAR